MVTKNGKTYITVQEIIDKYGITKTAFYNWIKGRGIKPAYIEKCIAYYEKEQIESLPQVRAREQKSKYLTDDQKALIHGYSTMSLDCGEIARKMNIDPKYVQLVLSGEYDAREAKEKEKEENPKQDGVSEQAMKELIRALIAVDGWLSKLDKKMDCIETCVTRMDTGLDELKRLYRANSVNANNALCEIANAAKKIECELK